jgi:hypothetical protein
LTDFDLLHNSDPLTTHGLNTCGSKLELNLPSGGEPSSLVWKDFMVSILTRQGTFGSSTLCFLMPSTLIAKSFRPSGMHIPLGVHIQMIRVHRYENLDYLDRPNLGYTKMNVKESIQMSLTSIMVFMVRQSTTMQQVLDIQ